MIRSLFAAALFSAALSASAQSTPAANFTDMWWNPAESGWGVSFAQHTPSNQVFAVWYTYDPRESGSSGFKPIWFVMPGGTWTSANSITGPVFVANGVPFNQSGSNPQITSVGSFTFTFTNANSAQFAYNIAAPGGLPPSDPAFNLPTMSGVKSIVRQGF
ncbi:MAG: hypothetical protein ABIQ72_06730 [Usitatibacter sp.]